MLPWKTTHMHKASNMSHSESQFLISVFDQKFISIYSQRRRIGGTGDDNSKLGPTHSPQ